MNSQLRNLNQRVVKKLKFQDDHWLYTGTIDRAGFGYLTERFQGRTLRFYAHRIIWFYRNGHTDKRFVNTCGFKHCVKPDHWRFK